MIKVEHINPFLLASTKVFSEMCGIKLQIGKPYISEQIKAEDSIMIIIGITGEIKGQVIINLSKEATLDIASKMMMMPVTEIDEMVNSAIGELGNMILGNSATIFYSNNINIDITPPTIGRGDVKFTSVYTHNICIPLSYDNFNMTFNVAVKEK